MTACDKASQSNEHGPEHEAMWINFSTVHEDMLPYMIKIYVGGVNVVSAEPAHGEAAVVLVAARVP